MSNKLKILVVLTLIMVALIPFVSAVTEITVEKKELIDSQYGVFTDVLGIGNQIYKVTYSDGTTEEVSVFGKTLNLGAITEMQQGTDIASTVCYNAKTSVRVKTIQDSANSFSDTHKIEVWENELGGSVDLLIANFPTYKVYDTNPFQSSSTISTPYSIEIPYRGYAADETFPFMVVEYQMKKDGTWVRLANPGWEATSTYMSDVKWYSTYQSGTGRGSLTGGTCRYTVPQPSVGATPTTPPPVSTRTIQITSSPAGAAVTSSGQALGTTPFSLTLDSSSAKILTFNLAGYPSSSKGVDINTVSPVSVIMLSPVVTGQGTPVVTTQGTPVQTTQGIPVVTTAGTPVQTTTSGSGGMTLETEQPSSGATVTYEQESPLNATNILIVLVVALIAVVGYSKMGGKRKGGKSKGRK